VKTIVVAEKTPQFAEDKDIAAKVREDELRPVLSSGGRVRLDFSGIAGATQSFIHAMISDLIRSLGSDVLDRMEFANCDEALQSIIEIVVEYSQYEA